MHNIKNRIFFPIIWLLFLLIVLYIYFFQQNLFLDYLKSLLAMGGVAYVIYFLLGCVRGFTMIPATYLTALGLIFFPPLPLFVMTLISTMVSAICIYYLSESLHLYKYFERKHKKSIDRLRNSLKKNELVAVIMGNLIPIWPADLTAYVCGIMKLNKRKFLIGTLIGQGIYSGFFIFLGHYLIKLFLLD